MRSPTRTTSPVAAAPLASARLASARLAVALFATLSLAGAVCSGGSSKPGPPNGGDDGPASSTIDVEEPGCVTGRAPEGVLVDGPVPLDADGDGGEDEASLYEVEDVALDLVVRYARGGRTVVRLDGDSVGTFAAVRVDRVADIDGDGDDDAWLVVGAGASVEVVTLVVADGCVVERPTLDGAFIDFPIGASFGSLRGVECIEGLDGKLDGFLEHAAENVGETRYRGTSTRWTLADGVLVRGDGLPLEVDLGAEDGSRYATLTCR